MSRKTLRIAAILHLPAWFIPKDENQELFPALMQKTPKRKS
jgi:hypothetical protein